MRAKVRGRDRPGTPRDRTRFRAGDRAASLGRPETCRARSTRGRCKLRQQSTSRSCGCQSWATFASCARSRAARVFRRGLAGRRQRIQPSARAVFASGDSGIFPAAFKQSHLFEPAERAVERSVSSQQPSVRCATKCFGQLVPMECVLAAGPKIERSLANRDLERDEMPGFPPHLANITQISADSQGALRRREKLLLGNLPISYPTRSCARVEPFQRVSPRVFSDGLRDARPAVTHSQGERT